MDRPSKEFALAVAFGLVLFVTVLAVVIVSRPSSDTALAAPLADSHCYWEYLPFPPWETLVCPTATPEPPTATADPLR